MFLSFRSEAKCKSVAKKRVAAETQSSFVEQAGETTCCWEGLTIVQLKQHSCNYKPERPRAPGKTEDGTTGEKLMELERPSNGPGPCT
jgi:hypothetical protein